LNIRATARIGVPSHRAAISKACFSLDSLWYAISLLEIIHTKSTCVNKILCILFQAMKKQHGGKRKGAGRPPEGKKRYNVTLTEDNVKRVKKRKEKLSPLLDRLLARSLG
jgi:hypothetical protein